MNLTLGSLAFLKTWLLPESERAGTEWDSAIAAIGKGSALALQRHCNRQFARAVADTYECSADRAHVVLPRYPVEAVTKIEIRRSLTEGWVELTDVIVNQNLAGGFLLFGSDLGSYDERLRITYTGGYWLDESGEAPTWQQGSAALSINDETVAVTFPTAFATAPAVQPFVIPAPDGVFIQVVPQDITTTGFTAKLGFPVPTTGYTLQWTACVEAASEAEYPAFLQDTVALSAAAESLAVAFAENFQGAPAVQLFVIPPSGGQLIAAAPTDITAEGFTARFGAPIPASGYSLQWTASLSAAAAQPAGSTAVPSDLQLAWMQQCAHLWRQKDKLGSALASNSGEAVAASYALAEGIAETVYHYRRLSLS